MQKVRVAVLRGGPSSHYDLSLGTGAMVLKHMPEDYLAHDIFISKNGLWHRDGVERSPERALAGIDLVFNALHGDFGEDGRVQKILDALQLPYTGSQALPSALGMNKAFSKDIFAKEGIKTPYFKIVKKSDDQAQIQNYVFNHFYLPFVVKPAAGGQSEGLTIVQDFRYLAEALAAAFSVSDTVLIEEFVRGKEASVGVIEDFRNQSLYSLLPVEIRDKTVVAPGLFGAAEKQALQDLAMAVHKLLGLRHYSQSDFIVTPRRGVYFLEVSTLPDLHPESRFSQGLGSIGASLKDFLKHILDAAR
jgi:D-alanine--D-alanine ligase